MVFKPRGFVSAFAETKPARNFQMRGELNFQTPWKLLGGPSLFTLKSALWVLAGREGSNLRMAESKSAEYNSKINNLSEFSSSVHPLTALGISLRSECRLFRKCWDDTG